MVVQPSKHPTAVWSKDGLMCKPPSPVTLSSTCKYLRSARSRRHLSGLQRHPLDSVKTIRDNVSKFVVQSRTTDPFLNLAIEDVLLKTSDPNTHILFTYVNRPCVVIGRNQNPWLEVNLAALKDGVPTTAENRGRGREETMLVRRRSGGGTVFHDEGNLNYSFIVPNDKRFTRDKHAEMVVRAVQEVSADHTVNGEKVLDAVLKRGIRVNERHDIVMPARTEAGGTVVDENRMVKVSGSAYKLTRGRALHHGTLLFSSPNLQSIGSFLHSPARGFIDAKGVDSVRSPIGNLRYTPEVAMQNALRDELETSIARVFQDNYHDGRVSFGSIEPTDMEDHSTINTGAAELWSSEWKYLQTPAFTFTNRRLPGEGFQPSKQPQHLPPSTKVVLKAKHGIIVESHLSISDDPAVADAEAAQIRSVLQDKKLHEISDWKQILAGADRWTDCSTGALIAWLSEMFPPVPE